MAYPLYSLVRVIRLNTPERHISGHEGLVRQPRVGDIGCIVEVVDDMVNKEVYTVENADVGGFTIWLADFQQNELIFLSSP